MEKEILIPEGYEARIEGNKITLKLKESKDERIMKDIITTLSIGVACNESALHPGATTTLKEAIAYLERLKQQKPAEWSEEDKVMLNNIIWSIHMKSIIKPLYEMDDRSRYKKYEDFLKALPERFNLQPKREWSEEDENRLNNLYRIIDDNNYWNEASKQGFKNFLKSLRPSWKPSENKDVYEIAYERYPINNRLVREITKDINEDTRDGFIDGYNYCNSTHWKPSKKQMEALEDAFRKDGGNEYRKVINSLYCDLQKLL